MTDFNREKHWNTIYTSKTPKEVSWYQPTPSSSLELIANSGISKDAPIIDVGGGDSFLVDHLLELGYSNITVLDISEKAIERAQKRVGSHPHVKWIVSDITQFTPSSPYTLWHDRAAFHFLTQPADIDAYRQLTREFISPKGQLIIGTFSENGPLKCSGINIQQYSEEELNTVFETHFEEEESYQIFHPTPFDTQQEFTFKRFRKK